MIDFDKLFESVDPVKLRQIGKAMVNGADAKTVRGMFAEAGVELSEEDIAKVSGGIVAKLSEDAETERELSDDELDQVAGGGCGTRGGGCEE